MVCSEARAQTPVWEHQFPDLTPVAGAVERPVGIGTSEQHVLVAGTKYITSTTSVMSLVLYDFFSCTSGCTGGPPSGVSATGKVLAEAQFPITANKAIREAKVVAFSTGNSIYVQAFIAGTEAKSNGDLRVVVAAFHTNVLTMPTSLALTWSASETLPGAATGTNEVPVGIAILTTSPTNITPAYVAVVSEATGYGNGKDMNVRVYDASTGAKIMDQYWTSSGTADDVPIGVALEYSSSSSGANVLVGVTTPVSGSSPPRTQAVVLGWRAESNYLPGTNLPTGTAMTGSPLTLSQTSTQSDVLKAVTPQSGPQVSPNVIAFAAHRTDTGTSPVKQDFLTWVMLITPSGGAAISDSLAEMWNQTYDDLTPGSGEDVDIPVALAVFDISPGGTITSGFRIAVTGTTRTQSGTTTDIATVCYKVSTQSLMWWAHYDNSNNGSNTDNNDYPTSMSYVAFTSEDKRLFIAGATDKVGGTGTPNYDYLSFYYDPADSGAIPRPHGWLPDGSIPALPWSGGSADGFDEATSITARIMYIGGNQYNGIFKTGRSDHPTDAFDWVTTRITP
ncbi:MAG: hypothetical protein ACKVW3_17095 [Phycisphaerales bacterium]